MMLQRGVVIDTSDGHYRIFFDGDTVSHLDTSPLKENASIIALLLEAWMCLLSDSPLNRRKSQSAPKRTYRRFKATLLSKALRATIVDYSNLAHKLVSSMSLYGSDTPTGEWIPEFRDTPIFKVYHLWYRTGDPLLLSYIYSFLNFGKKLDFYDETLNSTALRSWEEVENRLTGLQMPEQTIPWLGKIMKAFVPRFPRTNLFPKFGPGRVSERGIFGSIAKANNLAFDPMIDRALFTGHFSNYGLDGELGATPDKIIPDPSVWHSDGKRSSRTSRLKFVPKDIKTSRTICMEPNTFMFAQQAIRLRLNDTITRTCASRLVHLDDQSVNRHLARYGSETGLIDTIDLSAASDSVSVELVKRIFPREILYHLLATRTQDVLLPSGEVRRVVKFAPMGSALCFPVQSLIFASVVVYAAMLRTYGMSVEEGLGDQCVDVDRFIREHFISRMVDADPSRNLFHPASIFGDDICVDSELTQTVLLLLTSLGFVANVAKSFVSSQSFRESCGGFYAGGDDISPLYFRIKRFNGALNPGTVMSMIAGANHAGDRRYLNLRRLYIHRLLFDEVAGVRTYKGVNSFLFTSDRSKTYGIFSTRPRNSHLRKRFHKELNPLLPSYERDEIRCIMNTAEERITRRKYEIDAHDRYKYLQWWSSRTGEITSECTFGASRVDTSGSRLVRRWIPDEV